VADAHCPDCSILAIVDNLQAAIGFAIERYGIDRETVAKLAAWALSKVYERQQAHYGEVATGLIYGMANSGLTRSLLASEHFHGDMCCEPATYLLGRLCDRIENEILPE
jgi:hypothetical protein